MAKSMKRRVVLAGTATALAAPVLLRWPAQAAEFSFKVGNNLPVTHPMNVRLSEAVAAIRQETGGQVQFETFPNSVLGGDTDMLSQLRSGALEFLLMSGGLLSALSPVTGIYNTAFIFENYDAVWPAMDGAVGSYVRGLIEKVNLHAMPKLWNNGFRQMTSGTKVIRTPEDLRGFKMRVPVSRIFVSLFRGLDAAPTSLNFSELYSALQTGVVDGQENSLTLIDNAKLYEVQKSTALTNHIWDGFFMLANGRVWKQLNAPTQDILGRNFDAAALKMRADTITLDETSEASLKAKGMMVNTTQSAPFRDKLRRAGYYAEWKTRFGEEAWSVLEKAVGPLT